MDTFHPFPRLPYELRTYIWSLVMHPRPLHLRIQNTRPSRLGPVLYISSPTPSPAVMQVCRESRRYAPYQKAFVTGIEPRYVWVNFDADMICVPVQALGRVSDLEPHERDIQRLGLLVTADDDMVGTYCYSWRECLEEFPLLRELYFLAIRDCRAWWDAVDWGFRRCHPDNVRFVDLSSGLMLTCDQLTMCCEWELYWSFDGHGQVTDLDTYDLEEHIEMDITGLYSLLSEYMEVD